jgi:hypothetical protein
LVTGAESSAASIAGCGLYSWCELIGANSTTTTTVTTALLEIDVTFVEMDRTGGRAQDESREGELFV